MKKLNQIYSTLSSNNIFIFFFLFFLILLAYHTLFSSYFESDEWFYMTYYFPLTRDPNGWLTAFLGIFSNASYLSGGQHVVPIASLIYYLNTKLFGLNFVPYAFMSLLVHTINSFLIFVFVKILFKKNPLLEKNSFALLSALFFALSPIPMHAFTGFAAFYGQNVLSTTFLILCLLFYEVTFIKKTKKYLYFTIFFLFLALFTQESTTFLFFVLPAMTFFRKKTFSYRLLGLLWASCLFIYVFIRFFIPNMQYLIEHIARKLFPFMHIVVHTTNKAASGLAIYPNLPAELLLRTITYPLKMLGSIFIPKEIIAAIAQVLAPIIDPHPPGGDNAIQAAFANYSGQAIFIYASAILLLAYCILGVTKALKKKRIEEARIIFMSLSIIIFGALPLVALIFTFPLWGYDIYFDTRYYYTPHIGAAILFPLILISLAGYFANLFRSNKTVLIATLIFIAYVLCNIYPFASSIKTNTQNFSQDRRMIVDQLTGYLPKLPAKSVFYIETDGKGPFVSLPFFTSVPQAITVAYYSRSPLPDSFFDKPLFAGKPEGYQYENDHGFGYYTSKKELIAALKSHKFSINNVYAFYYYQKDAKINNITKKTREELDRL